MKGMRLLVSATIILIALSGCARSIDTDVKKPIENVDVKADEKTTQITENNSEKDDMTDDFETMAFVTAVVNEERAFSIELEDNETAKAFYKKLKEDELIIVFEKTRGNSTMCYLPWNLPFDDKDITVQCGDIMLHGGNQLQIFYGENEGTQTKIGRINDDEDSIKEFFGRDEEVTVRFFLEWTE